ncbi:MAG: hypothetical protein R3F34_17195 [Planctomycetota bacterium]
MARLVALVRDAVSLWSRAAALVATDAAGLGTAASEVPVARAFDAGAEWMRDALTHLRGERPDGVADFVALGLVKYAAASVTALAAASLALLPWIQGAAPTSGGSALAPSIALVPAVAAFYLVEVRFVFAFPCALDGATRPLVASHRLVARIGTLRALGELVPIAARMALGLLAPRRARTRWATGCLAIVLWYEDVKRHRGPVDATRRPTGGGERRSGRHGDSACSAERPHGRGNGRGVAAGDRGAARLRPARRRWRPRGPPPRHSPPRARARRVARAAWLGAALLLGRDRALGRKPRRAGVGDVRSTRTNSTCGRSTYQQRAVDSRRPTETVVAVAQAGRDPPGCRCVALAGHLRRSGHRVHARGPALPRCAALAWCEDRFETASGPVLVSKGCADTLPLR